MLPKGCYDWDYEKHYNNLTLCCNCGHKFNSVGCQNVRRLFNLTLLWLWV